MSRDWSSFDTGALEEILACMMDSDRYINYATKQVIVRTLKQELVKRGLKQYA